MGNSKFKGAEIELVATADMKRMKSLDSLSAAIGGDFIVRYDHGIACPGDLDGITEVIAVPVRYQDKIRLLDGIGGFGHRIPLDEGVDQNLVLSVIEKKTGMSDKCHFHHNSSISQSEFTLSTGACQLIMTWILVKHPVYDTATQYAAAVIEH